MSPDPRTAKKTIGIFQFNFEKLLYYNTADAAFQ